jgi:hypothetical protein
MKWIGSVGACNFTKAMIREFEILYTSGTIPQTHVLRRCRRLYVARGDGGVWYWHYYQNRRRRIRLWSAENTSPMIITNLYSLIDGFYSVAGDYCAKCRNPLLYERRGVCRACQIKFRAMRFEFLEWDKLQSCNVAHRKMVTLNKEREREYEGA